MPVTARGYIPRLMTGRCRSGSDGGGALYHAVDDQRDDWGRAVCGAKPGERGNGWSEYRGAEITCQRCIKMLQRDGRTDAQRDAKITAQLERSRALGLS